MITIGGIVMMLVGIVIGVALMAVWLYDEVRELDKENQRLHDECDTLEVMWRQPQSANKVWREIENVEEN